MKDIVQSFRSDLFSGAARFSSLVARAALAWQLPQALHALVQV